MEFIKKYSAGILFTIILAIISNFLSGLVPQNVIGAGVFALLIGMALNPIVSKHTIFTNGFNFTSKKILRLAIILLGATLSFTQVVEVGKFSLIVMTFTLITAFG